MITNYVHINVLNYFKLDAIVVKKWTIFDIITINCVLSRQK